MKWTDDAECQAKHPQCKVALQESKSGHRVMGTGVQTFTTKVRADPTVLNPPETARVLCTNLQGSCSDNIWQRQ